jgi:hypothetical protein
LEVAEHITNNIYRIYALIGLAGCLRGERRLTACTSALTLIDDLPGSIGASPLAEIAPLLPARLRAKATRMAMSFSDRWSDEEPRETSRIEPLLALAPSLSGKRRVDALTEVMRLTELLEEDWQLVDMIGILASQIPVNLQDELLRIVLEIRPVGLRAKALARVVPHLSVERRPNTVHEWLDLAPKLHRSELLDSLASIFPTLIGLGDDSVATEVYGAVTEVCSWWK